MFKSHMWLVPTVLEQTGTGHFHGRRKVLLDGAALWCSLQAINSNTKVDFKASLNALCPMQVSEMAQLLALFQFWKAPIPS